MSETAVEALVRENIGLAVWFADKCSVGFDYDDCFADALVGLWKAAQKCDPGRQIAFSTYASHRIHGEIRDGKRQRDHLSRRQREKGFDPGAPVSLDALVTPSGRPIDFPDPHDRIAEIDDESEAATRHEWLTWALDQLPYNQQVVIRHWITAEQNAGILAADELGVSQGRVSQLRGTALAHLRKLASPQLRAVS